jgi:hypothetical protein
LRCPAASEVPFSQFLNKVRTINQDKPEFFTEKENKIKIRYISLLLKLFPSSCLLKRQHSYDGARE